MHPIGGYFSLELPQREAYHRDAIALNTGRNCLEYILRSRRYSHVYIPYYTCEVVLEPFRKLGVGHSFYHVDENLELTSPIELQEGEALLYTDYFGLKHRYAMQLAARYGGRLIVDCTQAFYARPLPGVDTFYTCRKFFGVPDGAYLYTDSPLPDRFDRDESHDRVSFLVKRLDLGAEAGYADFRQQSERLVGQPIKLMSHLTMRMMQGIDYDAAARRRRANYLFLHSHLAATNGLRLSLDAAAVPMVYPYLSDDPTLKQRLIAAKVFVATYWPNVLEWCAPGDFEHRMAGRCIFIPIDQRYGTDSMLRIVDIIQRQQ